MRQVRKDLEKLVKEAAKKVLENKPAKFKELPRVFIEKTKDRKFGDYSSNIALLLSKTAGDSPQKTAKEIEKYLIGHKNLPCRVTVASPGFINFTLKDEKLYEILSAVLQDKERFGRFEKKHQKVQVEFVSANPTGPLHVGHGRGAATGDCLANILSAYGYKVTREYYLNDIGNQIDTLGLSLKWRYLEAIGEKINFPEEWNGTQTYQGDYLKDIAAFIKEKHGNDWKEKEVTFFSQFAMEEITEGIKTDLEYFGVKFDRWFRESALHRRKEVDGILKKLRKKGYLEEKEGALWFKSSLLGDSKDRVIIKKNGASTYLASDLAYHARKFKHFTQAINVWGADHHGYILRMKAAVKALDYDPENLKIVLVQLVKLSRGGKQIPMSTRKGEFVTLREVIREVGKDAARFIFMTRRSDAQLDFDLELAQKKSLDNPVYYIQYAHARLCSILRFAEDKGINSEKIYSAEFSLLQEKEELDLIKLLAGFPDVIENCALSLEPHRLTGYLREVAQSFHSFYSIRRVITDDLGLSISRLSLIKAVQIVIRNALNLLGVTAPEKM